MNAPSSYPNPRLRGWRFAEGVPSASVWFRCFRKAFQPLFGAMWRTRVFNRRVEPTAGGAVYICNHQSFLDPILMSYSLRRPMGYMARDTLFRVPVFGELIRSVNAFPVRRDQVDISAMKEALRRVSAGEQVGIFAEGTRTHDGRISHLLPIAALPSRRAKAVTIPVVIDGAYECWPRTQLLPEPGLISVQYGRPISSDEAAGYTGEQLMTRVRREMIEIQADLRRRTGRPALKYD